MKNLISAIIIIVLWECKHEIMWILGKLASIAQSFLLTFL